MTNELLSLSEGQPIVYGGNRVAYVSSELAASFRPGDHLLMVEDTGDLLRVPAAQVAIAQRAVTDAQRAFLALARVSDDAISAFFEAFAGRLEDDEAFRAIAHANAEDVDAARARGRSTTRLVLSDKMRSDMIAGLRVWRDAKACRDELVERVDNQGFTVELRKAGLGVVGFVFEGRPNVFADACGVLRSGNTVVFRIGSDALGTARAIAQHALVPALAHAGLPPGCAVLLDSKERSAGHALFRDARLALAVARGSGPAVAQLGAVARQAGVAVSLHGTGGAWLVATEHADRERLGYCVRNSLDRKVCNTLNTCVLVGPDKKALAEIVLSNLEAAARVRGTACKLHVTASARNLVPESWFTEHVTVDRADGPREEKRAEIISADSLGTEWEWESSPEMTLVDADDLDAAIALFNAHSPRFVGSIASSDAKERDAFWSAIDAPFVGDGFTRWVDGQYALNRPELGLSNWQFGRLFGRGGILSGDSVFTVRARAVQHDPALAR